MAAGMEAARRRRGRNGMGRRRTALPYGSSRRKILRMSDGDRRGESDPADDLKKGLGLLFRAAEGAARGIRKELGRTEWGKTLDDAGRELVRAANNVIGRVSSEILKGGSGEPRPGAGDEPPHGSEGSSTDERDERGNDEWRGRSDHPDAKPKGPTPHDPGFRIAVDVTTDPNDRR